jgi:hypothetical protein
MSNCEIAKAELHRLWPEGTPTTLGQMKISSANYETLKNSIPDQEILLQSVFAEGELEEITTRYAPYAAGFTPFLGTLGEAVICIGNTEGNKGKVALLDMDFGLFMLDDSLEEFQQKLIKQ